jgi:hypothetical protein
VEKTAVTPPRWAKSALQNPRRLILLAILLVSALSVFFWEPRLSEQIQAIAWRRQCISYTTVPERVVFEEDAVAIRQLVGQVGYTQTIGGRWCYVPQCWLKEVPGLQTQGTVFLHSRVSPSGHFRLVGMDITVQPGYSLESTGNVDDLSLVATIVDPSGGLESDRPIRLAETTLWIRQASPVPMRFYAGQPDPNDPSHFLIAYQRGYQRGIIDAWLKNDDTIQVRPRTGHITQDHAPLVWDPGN